jgi:hypothetical protein
MLYSLQKVTGLCREISTVYSYNNMKQVKLCEHSADFLNVKVV